MEFVCGVRTAGPISRVQRYKCDGNGTIAGRGEDSSMADAAYKRAGRDAGGTKPDPAMVLHFLLFGLRSD
jgi:hypothetical protein